RTRPDPTALSQFVDSLQALMTDTGQGVIVGTHPLLFAVTAEIGVGQVAAIEAMADVVRLSLDAVVRSGATKTSTPSTASAGAVDAQYATLLAQRNDVLATMQKSIETVSNKYAGPVAKATSDVAQQQLEKDAAFAAAAARELAAASEKANQYARAAST